MWAFSMPFCNNGAVVAYKPIKDTESYFVMCIFDFGNQIVSG